MKIETVVTAVPKKVVKQLTSQKQRIARVNTIPGINTKAVAVIRDFFVENVGYDDLPIACLGRLNDKNVSLQSSDSEIVESGVLPLKAKDTILLEIQLQEDLIVSVDLNEVLTASKEFDAAVDENDEEDIADRLRDQLVVGIPRAEDGGTMDMLSFIPFLDLTQCKHCAILDESFDSHNLETNRWKALPITEITAFI